MLITFTSKIMKTATVRYELQVLEFFLRFESINIQELKSVLRFSNENSQTFFLTKLYSTTVSLRKRTFMFYAQNTNPPKKSIKIYI